MEEWPAKIRMTILPIWLWGWCTDLIRTEAMSENAPIYSINDYPYFFYNYYICGVHVRKWKGHWILYRNDDRPEDFVLEKRGKDQTTPLGNWSGRWVFGWIYDPAKSWFYGWL